MYRPICLLVVLFILNGSFAQKKMSMTKADNGLTPAEKAGGWQLLFDGKSTAGWHGYGADAPAADWKVANGSVTLTPDKSDTSRHGNDLVTNDEFGDFHLKLDWKISPNGNSGILFFVHEDAEKYPATYNTGLEMQVLDNGTSTRLGHPDAKIYTHRAGDLYDLLASKEAMRPQGEWNEVEIMSKNGKLDFYINKVHALSTILWNEQWKQMVSISKFKDMPGFGIHKQGKIALQDHGDIVSFKNIRIKKLN